MPLTPEEQIELEELRNAESKGNTNNVIETSNNALSSDEVSELEELKSLERSSNEQSVSRTDAATRGAVQGATFGFADEISGGIESALTDKSYEEARDESRAAFDRAKNAHTAAFFGGELIGGIASGIATGGAGAGMRGAAILGGLYSTGASNRTGIDLAQDAVIGAALGVAGEKTLRGIGKFAKNLFAKSSSASKVIAEGLSNSTDDIAVSLETNWLSLAFAKGANNADEVLTDPAWLRTVQNHVNKAPSSINKIVKKAKESMNHKFNSIELNNIDVSDDLLNSKIFNDLINESKKELVGTSDAAKWIKVFQDDLTNGKLVGDISDGATFEQLAKIKKHIGGVLSRNKSAGQGIGEAAFNDKFGNKLLSQFTSKLDDRLAVIDTTGTYAEVNKQFSLLKTAEAVIPKGGEKANAAEISTFFNNLGSSKGATKGSIFFENMQQFDVINGTSYSQQVIQDVKPIVDNFVLTNMAQFNSTMDQATSLVFRGRALSSISPILAPLAAGEPVLIRLANKAGKISSQVAEKFKIPRTVKGITDNAPIVSKKLSLIEPAAAIAFNQAFDEFSKSGDDTELKSLVTQSLSNPNSVVLFEEGTGFEGKVTSPEEAAQIRADIMASQLPLREKIQNITELEATGNIPNIEVPVEEPKNSLDIVRLQRPRENLNLVRRVEEELGE